MIMKTVVMNVIIIAVYGKNVLNMEPIRRNGLRPCQDSKMTIAKKLIGNKNNPQTARHQKITSVLLVSSK